MGFRTIIIIAALYGLYWIIRKTLNNKKNTPEEREAENMVECKFCGTHLPVSTAIEEGETFYCCQQHKENDMQKSKKQDN